MSAAVEISSYACTSEIPGHEDSVNALAFSPEGIYLASGGDDGVLLVVDPTNGRIVHKLRFGNPVTTLLWHAHASYELFVGCGDGQVMVVRVEGENPVIIIFYLRVLF